MVIEKIEELRTKLNDLIEKGADFEDIQRTSSLLDECLIEYYHEKLEKE